MPAESSLKVNPIAGETFHPLPEEQQGKITVSARKSTKPIWSGSRSLSSTRRSVRNAKSLRIVFTPIHGTGGVIVKPMLQRLGFRFRGRAAQDRFDGAFPTVKSPNPENAEALRLGIELAEKTNADLVLATDPDCDRMGVGRPEPAPENWYC